MIKKKIQIKFFTKKVQLCYSAAHNVAVNFTDFYSLCTDLGLYVTTYAFMDTHKRKKPKS